MKRRYRRYFIMLELEDKNFEAFANKEVKGYAKIEIKNTQGSLAINCQNLKSSSNGNRYRWYLINTKIDGAPTIVEIGPMEVDEKGKGEIVCEFNTENVKGSMEKIDNFNVLVLTVQNKEDKSKLHTPLVGYMDKERPSSWRYALGKHLYIPLVKENIINEKKLETKVKKYKDEPKEIKERIKEEVQEEAKEKVKKEIKNKVEEEIINKVKVKEKVKEEVKKQSKVEIKEKIINKVGKEIQEGVPKEVKEIKDYKKEIKDYKEDNNIVERQAEENEYEVQMQAYIENSLKDFQKIEPFVNNLENYTWWQIPYNVETMYRAYMPFIWYLDSLKESKEDYISKMLQIIYIHQHHIFGICYDENKKVKYYAYGIPGRNLPLEQPFQLNKNLTYWHPCNDVPVNIESYGYWILSIDPKSGDAIKIK